MYPLHHATQPGPDIDDVVSGERGDLGDTQVGDERPAAHGFSPFPVYVWPDSVPNWGGLRNQVNT